MLSKIIQNYVQALRDQNIQLSSYADLRNNLPLPLKDYIDQELYVLFRSHGICLTKMLSKDGLNNCNIFAPLTQEMLQGFASKIQPELSNKDFIAKLSDALSDEWVATILGNEAREVELTLAAIDIKIDEYYRIYSGTPNAETTPQPCAGVSEGLHLDHSGKKLAPEEMSDLIDSITCAENSSSVTSVDLSNCGSIYIDNIILLLMSLPNLRKLDLHDTGLAKTGNTPDEVRSLYEAISSHPSLRDLDIQRTGIDTLPLLIHCARSDSSKLMHLSINKPSFKDCVFVSMWCGILTRIKNIADLHVIPSFSLEDCLGIVNKRLLDRADKNLHGLDSADNHELIASLIGEGQEVAE
ncbi:MAG: hypothetical protein V4485_02825 [Pseudomonadota bacterium]